MHRNFEVSSEVSGEDDCLASIFVSVFIRVESTETDSSITIAVATANISSAAFISIPMSNWLPSAWADWYISSTCSWSTGDRSVNLTIAISTLLMIVSDEVTSLVYQTVVRTSEIFTDVFITAVIKSSKSDQTLVLQACWLLALVNVADAVILWTA